MSQGKFARSGNQPQKAPPVCKKPLPNPHVKPHPTSNVRIELKWQCQCDPGQTSYDNYDAPCIYNPSSSQWVCDGFSIIPPSAVHAVLDEAPFPFPSALGFECFTPCGEHVILSILIPPIGQRLDPYQFQVSAKKCNLITIVSGLG